MRGAEQQRVVAKVEYVEYRDQAEEEPEQMVRSFHNAQNTSVIV